MNAYQILVLLSVFISLYIMGYAFFKRNAPKSTYFILLAVSIFMYELGVFLETVSPNIESAYGAILISYLGLPYIPVFGLLFMMDYYGVHMKKWLPAALCALPVLTTLLVITWPLNGIYYTGMEYRPGPSARVILGGSPIYYALFAYLCAVNLCSLILIVRESRKREKGTHGREVIHFLAVCLPLLTTALYGARLTPYGLDITPIALIATSGLIAYSLFRFNLLQILPVAKDKILDGLGDAFIITDRKEHFLDANPAAKRLFPALGETLFLTPLSRVSGLPEKLALLEIPPKGLLVKLEQNGRYYRATKTTLQKNDEPLGHCLMLYDVTETKQLMDELQQRATFDRLTGVYNKETFMQLAGLEFDKLKASGGRAAALVLDPDHFKRINDIYGHPCGDIVLSAMASHLKRRFRKSDLFCRYGGQEFCAFIKGMDRQSALRLAEQLRFAMESETFLVNGNTFNITVSVGVALYEAGSHSVLEVLIADAQSAMFVAKQNGRNRFELYTQEKRAQEST